MGTENAGAAPSGAVRFRGKVDWWFYLLVVAANVVMLACAAGAFAPGKAGAAIEAAALPIAFVLIDGLTIPLIVRNYVEFDDRGDIVIAFGPSTLRESAAAIREVAETSNPLSSTAASLDRIRVRSRMLDTMVAVRDKDGFFAEVEKRCPNAQIARKPSRTTRRRR